MRERGEPSDPGGERRNQKFANRLVVNREQGRMEEIGNSLNERLSRPAGDDCKADRSNDWNVLQELSTLEDELDRTFEFGKDGKRRPDEEEEWIKRHEKRT